MTGVHVLILSILGAHFWQCARSYWAVSCVLSWLWCNARKAETDVAGYGGTQLSFRHSRDRTAGFLWVWDQPARQSKFQVRQDYIVRAGLKTKPNQTKIKPTNNNKTRKKIQMKIHEPGFHVASAESQRNLQMDVSGFLSYKRSPKAAYLHNSELRRDVWQEKNEELTSWKNSWTEGITWYVVAKGPLP